MITYITSKNKVLTMPPNKPLKILFKHTELHYILSYIRKKVFKKKYNMRCYKINHYLLEDQKRVPHPGVIPEHSPVLC